MGLQKLGITLAEQCARYAKACGKSSILCTKPVQVPNIEGLRYVRGLTRDVVQIGKNNPFELSIEMNEQSLRECLSLFKYRHGDKFLQAYKEEEIATIISAYNRNPKLTVTLLKTKYSLPKEDIYDLPRFNSTQIKSLVKDANSINEKFIIDACENTSFNYDQLEELMFQADMRIKDLGAKNVELINDIMKKLEIKKWGSLFDYDFFKELDIRTFDLKGFHKYVQEFNIENLPITAQNRLKTMDRNDILEFMKTHFLRNKQVLTEEYLTFKDMEQLIISKPITQEQLKKILAIYPCTSRNIGSFPKNWLDKIPKNELENSNRLIQDIISKFIENKDVKVFEQELSSILHKQVSVRYLDQGEYGIVHKIIVDGSEDTIIKTFKHYDITMNHGAGREPQRAMFLSSNFDDFAHTYCARVASSTDKDSYYIAQYIDDNVKLIKPPKITTKYKCTYIDNNGKNAINGINIDCGGCEIKEI